MGQREWDTDAERDRKRAYREQKKQAAEAEQAEAEQRTRDRYGYSASETRTQAQRNAAAARMLGVKLTDDLDEEVYVRRELRETEAYSRSLREDDEQRAQRLKRSEAYLRWRWAGYHEGTIASL